MDFKPGYLNTDISKTAKADIIHDIRCEKLPVQDGEAEEVYASGILEQILDNEDLVFAMNEMWRVLKKGGMLRIVVPNAEHSIAFQDPFDVRKFTPKTFQYFLEGAREYNLYGKVYGFKPFNSLNVNENERHILVVTMTK